MFLQRSTLLIVSLKAAPAGGPRAEAICFFSLWVFRFLSLCRPRRNVSLILCNLVYTFTSSGILTILVITLCRPPQPASRLRCYVQVSKLNRQPSGASVASGEPPNKHKLPTDQANTNTMQGTEMMEEHLVRRHNQKLTTPNMSRECSFVWISFCKSTNQATL